MDGTIVTSFGGNGSGDGTFNGINRISIFDGNLYISDALNRRIKIHDLDGVYVGQIPLFNEDEDEALLPSSVDARSGDLYISTDDGTALLEIDSIQKRSLDGTLAWETINFPNGKGIVSFDNGKVFHYNHQNSTNKVYTFTQSGSPSSDFLVNANTALRGRDIFAYDNELFVVGVPDNPSISIEDTYVFTQSGTLDRTLGIAGIRITVFDGLAYISTGITTIGVTQYGTIKVVDISDGTVMDTILLQGRINIGAIAVG
jgi:hypothetical protein